MKRNRTITLKLDSPGASHLADWIQAGLDYDHFSEEDGGGQAASSYETALDLKAQLIKQKVIVASDEPEQPKRGSFRVLRKAG